MKLKSLGKAFLILMGLLILLLSISYTAMLIRESMTTDKVAPTDGRFVQTRDALVYVRESGEPENPAILLIHGTGAWGAIWKDTEKELISKGYRVVTIDIPPFGFSEKLHGAESYSTDKQANRILDVIQNLKKPPIYALCHSVGCRPVMQAILQKPNIFKKFIQVDPALGFSEDQLSVHFQQNEPTFLKKGLMASSLFRDSIIATYGSSPWSIKPIFETFVFNKHSVTNDRVATLQKPLKVKGMTRAQGDWLQNLVINQDHSMYTDYASYNRLDIPVLLIWGKEDNITPLWQGKALKNMYKNASLIIIPHTGHIPYLEDTPTFNRVLIAFLENS